MLVFQYRAKYCNIFIWFRFVHSRHTAFSIHVFFRISNVCFVKKTPKFRNSLCTLRDCSSIFVRVGNESRSVIGTVLYGTINDVFQYLLLQILRIVFPIVIVFIVILFRTYSVSN